MKTLIVDNKKFENLMNPRVVYDGWTCYTKIYDGDILISEFVGPFQSYRILEEQT